MKRHLGIRGLMVAVALIAIGLAWATNVWKRGEFAFQPRHADLAAFCDSKAQWAAKSLSRMREDDLMHDERGHRCLWDCPMRRLPQREAERRKQQDTYRLWYREARWHQLLAGPLAHGPDVNRGNGPVWYRKPRWYKVLTGPVGNEPDVLSNGQDVDRGLGPRSPSFMEGWPTVSHPDLTTDADR